MNRAKRVAVVALCGGAVVAVVGAVAFGFVWFLGTPAGRYFLLCMAASATFWVLVIVVLLVREAWRESGPNDSDSLS